MVSAASPISSPPLPKVRRHAEFTLNTAAKHPDIVPELLQRLQANPDSQIRHLSAILLRKKIPGHWTKLPPPVQATTKHILLDRLSAETAVPVRRAAADVVAMIAKALRIETDWPELLTFLVHSSASPTALHRETALVLFASLLENEGSPLESQLIPLSAVLARDLVDPSSPPVRQAALQCTNALLPWITPTNAALLVSLLEPLVQFTHICLATGEEQGVVAVFELLLEMLEIRVPALQEAIPGLISLASTVALNRELGNGTRQQALQLIPWLAEFKPKQFVKLGLVTKSIEVLCRLMCEPPGDEEDDDEDEDEEDHEMSGARAAWSALDTLALHLPAKHVYAPIASFARQAIASPAWADRLGAMHALGVIVEGCVDSFRRHLSATLTIVCQGLSDAHPQVRAEAAFALGQLTEYLPDEVAEHHLQVLPLVGRLLSDTASVRTQDNACYAIDTLAEALGDELVPYLDQLMAALLHLVQHGATRVQESALAAIASMAGAVELAFTPYAAAVLPLLKHFMTKTGDRELVPRARATECFGLVCQALGREAIRPVLPEYMPLVLQGLSLEYAELREYTFGCAASLAEVLGEDMAAYADLVTAAVASVQAEEADKMQHERHRELAGVSSDDDEEEALGGTMLQIRTGVMDEKCAALHFLGAVARHGGRMLAPRLGEVGPVMMEACDNFHEDVRCQAYEGIVQLTRCVCNTFGVSPVSSEVQSALKSTFEALFKAVRTDASRSAVTAAVEGMGELLTMAGGDACVPFVEEMAYHVRNVLAGEAVCQEEGEEDQGGDDQHDEEEGEDETLLTTAAEVLPIMARQLGIARYLNYLSSHVEALRRHLRPAQPNVNRGTAIGSIAELIRLLGSHPTARIILLDNFLPILYREFRCEDDVNRRNAAFCMGVMFESCGTVVVGEAPRALQHLHALVSTDESDPDVRDNAIGAVCRIIDACGANLPLDRIVPGVLAALPLQEDFEEAEPVVRCLGNLLCGQAASQLESLLPGIVAALGALVLERECSEQCRDGAKQALCVFRSQHGAAAESLLATQLSQQALQALNST